MEQALYQYSSEHHNAAGHRILDDLVVAICGQPSAAEIQVKIGGLDAPGQLSLLMACVERMPYYRSIKDSRSGSICYEAASLLYRRKLPFTANDICQLLEQSKHGCGHGCDVAPPFEILVAYGAVHGLSQPLLDATRVFVDSLKGLVSIQSNNLKSRGSLVLTLDTSAESAGKCWSERFTRTLASMPQAERLLWQKYVVDMTVTMQCEMQKTTAKKAAKFLKEIGGTAALTRLEQFWPVPSEQLVWPIQTGGSHLLKHFVWLLEVISQDPSLSSRADALVCRLSQLDWKPQDKGQKVMISSAIYLSKRQSEPCFKSLCQIDNWCRSVPKSEYTGSKMEEIMKTALAQRK